MPIRLAKALGNQTAQYRWFAGLYIISCFFVIPLFIFSLSLAGWQVLVGVLVPIVVLIILVVVVNMLQTRRPLLLPQCLRSWDFLPLWMHSLEPWDRKVSWMLGHCCCCCKCCQTEALDEEQAAEKDVKDGHPLKMCDNPAINGKGDAATSLPPIIIKATSL